MTKKAFFGWAVLLALAGIGRHLAIPGILFSHKPALAFALFCNECSKKAGLVKGIVSQATNPSLNSVTD